LKNIAIIGAGLQAGRRLPALLDDKRVKVTDVVDKKFELADQLAQQTGAKPSTVWPKVVNDPGVDIVLVLTYPDSHADIAMAAMKNGKDVLCEKH